MAAPLRDEDFAARMAGLGLSPERTVGVAVSGGADSLALALLAARWGSVRALTVDHGLRPDSAAEARQVAAWMAERGIEHEVLVWGGEKPQSGLPAAARDARYRLLEEACRARGIAALLLAHHQDDQAETLLLRLARGSGLSGLAGMAPMAPPHTPAPWAAQTLRRYRPLLDVPKARLEATCREAGQPWIDDPSNRDPAFARTQARVLLADPPIEGLTAQRLAATAARLRRARDALEHYVERLLEAVAIDPAGYAVFDPAILRGVPAEIGLRTLSRLLAALGGHRYPPRLERVEQLHAALGEEGFSGATAAGCQLLPWSGGVALCREPAAAAAPVELTPGQWTVWDGRFAVLAEGASDGLSLGALGEAGWQALSASGRTADAGSMPHPARLALPAIRRGETLEAVPHLNLPPVGWRAEVLCLPRKSLGSSLSS